MEFLLILGQAAIPILGITLIVLLIVGVDKLWNKLVNVKNVSNIEVNDNFDILYQDLLKYYDTKVEIKRRKEIIIVIGIILTLILTFACVLYLQEYTKLDYDIATYIGIFLIGIEIIFLVKNMTFRTTYKKEIIERLAKSVNYSFEYSEDAKNILQNHYALIGFVDKTYTNICLDDYMVGTLDETANISLGDFNLEKVERYGDNSLYIPVFRGVVACMNYNNDIRNNIIIEEDRIVDTGTELPENFLSRLIEIYKKYGIVPEIRIKPSYVFLRIHTGEFFEPGMDPMDKQKLFNYYNVIKFINEVMTEIKNATEV